MDKLDEVESLNQMDDSGDIKNKILFSVLVVSTKLLLDKGTSYFIQLPPNLQRSFRCHADIPVLFVCTDSQVAHRTVQHSLAEKHRKLKKLLEIPNDEGRAGHVRDLQDRITDYFRRTGAKLKVDSIRKVCSIEFTFACN